jgi:hypothetical protein
MKVLSIDIVRRKFDDLTVTEVIPHINGVELRYEINGEQCISGILLDQNEFESFIKGNAVELHKGEIIITKVD